MEDNKRTLKINPELFNLKKKRKIKQKKDKLKKIMTNIIVIK
jgi:hypothetical protein